MKREPKKNFAEVLKQNAYKLTADTSPSKENPAFIKEKIRRGKEMLAIAGLPKD